MPRVEVGCEPNVVVQDYSEAPSIERASFSEKHSSYTGQAKSNWTFRGNESGNTHNCIIIVGGYLGIEEAYGPLATVANEADFNVITMEPPRAQRLDHALHPAHALHPERLLSQMVCRIAKDATDIYKIRSYDGIGHSMGGPGVVYAANRRPDTFSSVTLLGPAGVSKHGLLMLGRRVPTVTKEAITAMPDLANNFSLRDAHSIIKYICKNPHRTIAEAVAVSRSDVVEHVRRLGRLGIDTSAIIFTEDGFFKPHEIAARAAGALALLEELPYGHIAPLTHPNEVIEAQLQIFDKLHHMKEVA